MTLHEVSEATTLVQKAVGDEANIIFGAVVDENLADELRVTVIATGFGSERASMGREAAARAELRRAEVRPAAQVASITPLRERRNEAVEPIAPAAPAPAAAPGPRAGHAAAPSARVEAALPGATLQATLDDPGPAIATGATAPWLDLELEEEPQPVVAPEPLVAERQPQKRHAALPKPGLPAWSADDLDVPAFLRRQMD
jgi:hypothetical protein